MRPRPEQPGWGRLLPGGAGLVVAIALASGAQVVLREPPRTGSGTDDRPENWSATGARAGVAESRVLVMKDLRRLPAGDALFEGSVVRYRDGLGRPSAAQLSDVLAILPGEVPGLGVRREIEWRELGEAESTPTGRLELVDGQVLPGRPEPGPQDRESLGWRHARLGVVGVPLDSIRRLVLKPEAATVVNAERDDVIVLINGDQVRGIVDEVRFGSGEVSIDAAGRRSTIALDRVVQVAFANPGQAPAGARLWLRDRSVVGVRALSFKDGELACTPVLGAAALKIPLGEVSACAMASERLAPLSSLPPTRVQGEGGRVWTSPPAVGDATTAPLGAADIELPGPMSVSWELPASAALVGFSAELPPSARALGECTLVGLVNGVEAVREPLSAGRPRVGVVIPVGGPSPAMLTLRVESGKGGPIQNRVLLRGAMVLLGG